MPLLRPLEMRLAWALAGALALAGHSASAEQIGWSLAISNDSIGEAKDRWQSSSVQGALIFGDPWTGSLPKAFGDLIELRFRSDILAPADLDDPDPTDRRHAGVLALGVHSHFARGGVDLRAGADLVVIGEQTGLLDVQTELHKVFDFEKPNVDGFQIDDQVRLDVGGEIARVFAVGGSSFRPFAEAQIGTEDLVRIGADVTWGSATRDVVMLRSTATGQRVPAMSGPDGLAFTVGADVTYVDDSVYLPRSLGYELTPVRQRIRAGAHATHGPFDLFYGVAWLSEEFVAQPEGQVVGTAQLRVAF